VPWFRVDDDYWRHPKTTNLSLGARGLWVSAGSWVAANLTDGLVPANQLHVIAPNTPLRTIRKYADELVEAGFWGEVLGGSYAFHQWHSDPVRGKRNPSREEVESEKVAWRERQQRARQRRRAAS
jgi:hypothetical protein